MKKSRLAKLTTQGRRPGPPTIVHTCLIGVALLVYLALIPAAASINVALAFGPFLASRRTLQMVYNLARTLQS